MGDPLKHSQSSARLFGGVADDYLHIHTVMDSSKLFLADWRHRALLHNTFGIHVFEQLMGAAFKRKSDGVEVCTRTVISQHIMEDLGAIPTAGEFLREMPLKQWMTGIHAKQKQIMQNLTIEGKGSHEAYIRADILWHIISIKPDTSGKYLTANKKQGVLFSSYDKDSDCWDTDDIEYWAIQPISPICSDET